jgi:protein-L-isoaspartate(D-aspartate) O-methyltransferase
MVASMTELANVQPGMKVLEIGTGSGYQTAILAELGARVYSIERILELGESAKELLRRLGYESIQFRVGDGSVGWTENAPFGSIIVTAGAPRIPEPLLQQLEINGRLIIPIEDGYSQIISITTRTADRFEEKKSERCTFVPLIGKFGWEE